MASPDEIPPALASIAYRIPEETRASMTPTDLRIRCEYILDLNGQADACPNEYRAKALRRKAEHVLKSMPPGQYAEEHSSLLKAMAEANRGGETAAAMALMAELRELEYKHPQPPASMYESALVSALDRQLDRIEQSLPAIPPATKSRLFSRMRGR